MVEGLIKQCRARIAQLEAQMEDEDLTIEQAMILRDRYEEEHWLLSQLTGDKGTGRPKP